jgi:VCBS repeat-containing protein
VTCHLGTVTVTQVSHTDTVFSASHANKCEGSSTNSVEGTWAAEIDDNHPALEIVD